MDINDWLIKFKTNWENKDIEGVVSLFSEDVIYHETPFQKLIGHEEIRREWDSIKNQNELALSCDLFSREDSWYTVQWDLRYANNEKNQFHFGGVYLIELDAFGKCCEFRQFCEEDLFVK